MSATLPSSHIPAGFWVGLIRTTILGLAFLAVPVVQAASYYVDPATGSMSNPGTAASPWSTLEAVFTAKKTFAAGDVIYLRSGYHGAPYIKGYNSLTIQPDTGATPKLKTLVVNSSSQLVISGLDICPAHASPQTYVTGNLVDIQGGTSHITLQNCLIRGATDITNWSVTDWQTKLGKGSAINVYGSHSVIANNILQNVSFGISLQKTAVFSLVSHNTLTNFYNDASRVLSDDTVFEYNTFTNSFVSDSNHDDFFQSWSVGSDGKVGTGTVYRVTVRGNVFISHTDPNQPLKAAPQGVGCFDGMFEGWVIENNVISSKTYHGISLYGAINCTIVNNTVVENAAAGSSSVRPWILIHEHKDVSTGVPWPVKCSGNIVRNNITTSAASMPATAGVIDHNTATTAYGNYFANYANFSFSLLPTAPAVNAGSTANAPATDILGRTRTVPYDLGAYEYFPAPAITSTLAATATQGTPFSYAITASNNPENFQADGLPEGLTVASGTGVISGTPTTPGTYFITLGATNPVGTGTATLVLTVLPPQPAITSPAAASATEGTAFSYQITATNNPDSFQAASLPEGLTVDPGTGLISGTPTTAGTYTCVISATNSFGQGSSNLVLTILPHPPVITSALTTFATTDAVLNYTITATHSPDSFNATGLPDGLGVDTATGLISGTPTSTGTFSSTISASNAGGTGSATWVLTVSSPPPVAAPVISSAPVAGAVAGSAFDYNITASNYPSGFSATGLPDGLAADPLTGVISGSPTQSGIFSVVISATNSVGTGSKTLTLTILPAYHWSNFAGSPGLMGTLDGTGSDARFNTGAVPLAVDLGGNVYVADSLSHTLRKVTPTGEVTTIAGSPGLAGTADGTGSAARFNVPRAVVVDHDNNIILADSGNHTIRKITPTGIVTTLAGTPGSSGSANGTGSAARFNTPRGLALDANGNVYIADTSNHTVRKMTPAGVVTTLAGTPGSAGSADGTGSAARFNTLRGLAVDGSGNVYVADLLNHTIRRITPAGVVTTVAGSATKSGAVNGIGSTARFNNPYGLAIDTAGNLYVGDSLNHTIRKMIPSGTGWLVTTIGGNPGSTGTADGTGNAARFNLPYGIGVDVNGAVYVLDSNNCRISRGVSQPPPVITSNLTAVGTDGYAFNYTISAENNPVSYDATGLPTELGIDPVTGIISGTPNVSGTFTPTISATNAGGTTTATLVLTIHPPPPDITSSLAVTAVQGRTFSHQLTATYSPTGYSATGLPPGLDINSSTGLISGTPLESGTFDISVEATNSGGAGSATLSLTVLTPYSDWKSNHFGSNPPASLSDDNVVNNSAGIDNLMAYALGIDPFSASTMDLPQFGQTPVSGNDTMIFEFMRNTLATDLTYIVEVSNNLNPIDGWTPLCTFSLGAWSPSGSVTESGSGPVIQVRVQDSQPMKDSPARFIRLRATH